MLPPSVAGMALIPVPPFALSETGGDVVLAVDATLASAPARASEDDLRWWLHRAPTLEWTWARTYATTAPHWYVVLGRTPGMTLDDFVRAGRTIRTFGEPGVFYSSTNLYLHTEDRRLKFWCMWSADPTDDDATLINLATTERTYGDQQAVDMARVRRLRLAMPSP